jgi:hypothetical protein
MGDYLRVGLHEYYNENPNGLIRFFAYRSKFLWVCYQHPIEKFYSKLNEVSEHFILQNAL